MAALVLARLGVQPEAFGRMSLGFYLLLCRELEGLDIRYYYPSAAIQAVLVNINRDPEKSEAVEAFDFIPGWERIKTPEEIAAEEEAQAAAFLGALDAVTPEGK
jgi:hypothetical protein